MWAGMAGSGVVAEYLRTTWLQHAPPVAAAFVAALLGIAGSILCFAGLAAIKAGAQREWREDARAMQGRHRAGEAAPGLPGDSMPADYEERLGKQDRRIAEIFDLMQLVCTELNVDTSHADQTRPMLRVLPGGEAG
jgi:hypothetical protein